MVRLWPWKGEDNSPASFEKTLAALAGKISKSQSQLDSLRQRGRRYKALWTLYTSFAYLLCGIILFLVVGWKNWNVQEYTALAGSPVIIYLIRMGLAAYYNYRIDTVTQRLEDQQAERTKTIEKLKAATKYNSTQELLEKYGGAPPKPKKPSTPKAPKPIQNQPGRTSMGPPATANIGRPNHTPSQPSTPQPVPNVIPPQRIFSPPISPQSPQAQVGPPEFAPNAFSAPPQYAQASEVNAGGNWYDRVLDLLMGEDETLPRNRVALICQNCRLVNGQAPPGTKSLADLGKWRCFGCGTMNGEEDEAVKVVQEMKERIESQEKEVPEPESKGAEDSATGESGDMMEGSTDEVDVDSTEDTIEVKPTPSKRGRPKGSKKKS